VGCILAPLRGCMYEANVTIAGQSARACLRSWRVDNSDFIREESSG
jgi:hypothetical protein